jgi:hypothetical protein
MDIQSNTKSSKTGVYLQNFYPADMFHELEIVFFDVYLFIASKNKLALL